MCILYNKALFLCFMYVLFIPRIRVETQNDRKTAQYERKPHSENRVGNQLIPIQREHILNRVSSYVLIGGNSADLRLCFRQCRMLVFPWGVLFIRSLLLKDLKFNFYLQANIFSDPLDLATWELDRITVV